MGSAGIVWMDHDPSIVDTVRFWRLINTIDSRGILGFSLNFILKTTPLTMLARAADMPRMTTGATPDPQRVECVNHFDGGFAYAKTADMGQTALRARLLDEGHTAAPAMNSIACVLGNDRRANLNSARGLITGTALSDRMTSRRGD